MSNPNHKLAINAAKTIAAALHSPAKLLKDKAGKVYYIRPMAGGLCRGADVSGYRFVTQNPQKNSEWAERARQGDQITWVIYTPTNLWIGRVINGQVEEL